MPAPLPPSIPALEAFIQDLKDGTPNIRGIYVRDTLAYPIVQQPRGDSGFVSPRAGYLTQFQDASGIGLLAHDFLSGKDFYKLKAGQQVQVIYGDGHTENYTIDGVSKYQALQPNSPYSNMLDLTDNKRYSAGDVFNKMYGDKNRLVLQTCITKNGDTSWGRAFITATKTEPTPAAPAPPTNNTLRRLE